MFITIEGIDGVGKSTAANLLRWRLLNAFRDLEIIETCEPTEWIRDRIWDKSVDERTRMLLLCADRANHIQQLIKPAIERGATVICDRFGDSTIAYQGCGHELGYRDAVWADNVARDELRPDLTFWLDCPVDVALGRMDAEDRVRGSRFYELARAGYAQLFKTRSNVIRIDATQAIGVCVDQMFDAIAGCLI